VNISSSGIEKSYNKLKGLDYDGDFNISGKEIQFTNCLNNVKDNPSPENVKKAIDAMNKVTPDKNKQGEMRSALLITLIGTKCSDPPLVSELNNILKLFPEKNKAEWSENMMSLEPEVREKKPPKITNGQLEIDLAPTLCDTVDFNEETGMLKEMKTQGGSPYILPSFKAKFEQLKTERLDVGKDVLDGNTTINGVDQDITNQFLGKQKDSAVVNTYNSSDFDPDKFADFSVKIRKHVIKEGEQTITVERNAAIDRSTIQRLDPQTGKSNLMLIPQAREQLFKDFPDFQQFAADNKILNDKGELDNAKLDLVKNFVAKLPDTDKKMAFTSNFMEAYFVHSGKGASQEGVNEDNFTKILSSDKMLRSDDGRTIIDCQFFAAISQKVLGASKGKGELGIDSKDVVIDYVSKDKKDKGLHQVTIFNDTKSGKFYLQSNDKIEEITNLQLKMSGYNASKGKPPTNEQLIKAATYQSKVKIPEEAAKNSGLLAKQMPGEIKFYGDNLQPDPLSNQLTTGYTKDGDASNGGTKLRDNNGLLYFENFNGYSMPEKNNNVTFADGSKGDVTVTDVGPHNTFTGKTKDKQGNETNVIVSFNDKNEAIYTKVNEGFNTNRLSLEPELK
jgi:hypothetical protein